MVRIRFWDQNKCICFTCKWGRTFYLWQNQFQNWKTLKLVNSLDSYRVGNSGTTFHSDPWLHLFLNWGITIPQSFPIWCHFDVLATTPKYFSYWILHFLNNVCFANKYSTFQQGNNKNDKTQMKELDIISNVSILSNFHGYTIYRMCCLYSTASLFIYSFLKQKSILNKWVCRENFSLLSFDSTVCFFHEKLILNLVQKQSQVR